jgi:hypothetical protein
MNVKKHENSGETMSDEVKSDLVNQPGQMEREIAEKDVTKLDNLRKYWERALVAIVIVAVFYAWLRAFSPVSPENLVIGLMKSFSLTKEMPARRVTTNLNYLQLMYGLKYFLLAVLFLLPAAVIRFALMREPFPRIRWFAWIFLFVLIGMFARNLPVIGSIDFFIMAIGWSRILSVGWKEMSPEEMEVQA